MGVDHLASYGTQGVTSKWCYDGRYATLSIAVNTWRCCYPPVTLGRSAQRCGKRVKTLFVNMVFGTFPVIEIWNQTVCNPTSKKHHFDHTVLTQMWDIGATPHSFWRCLFTKPNGQVTHFEWQVELGEAKRSAEQIISTNTGVKMAWNIWEETWVDVTPWIQIFGKW